MHLGANYTTATLQTKIIHSTNSIFTPRIPNELLYVLKKKKKALHHNKTEGARARARAREIDRLGQSCVSLSIDEDDTVVASRQHLGPV